MPTLTQLEYLVALHRIGHFGRAAAACHVSQPTLSGQIAKVEEALGVVIFDRRAKPVVVTEPGAVIVQRAQEVLVAHARLVAAAGEEGVLSGELTLGIIPTLAPYVLPWFLGPFAEAYPAVQLTVVERTTEEIVREMRAHRLDAGLLATPLEEAGLQHEVVFYDPFYVYAHGASPLLAQAEVGLAAVEQEDLWLLEDGHCLRNQMVRLCGMGTRQILPQVQFEAGSLETIRALIDRLGGSTLIPETYARTLPVEVRRARVRALAAPTPTREVSLVSLTGHWKTDLLAATVASLRAHAPRSLPRELGDGEVLPVTL